MWRTLGKPAATPVTVTACPVAHVVGSNVSVRLARLPAGPTVASATSSLVAVTVTAPPDSVPNRTVYVFVPPSSIVTARRLNSTAASSSVTVTVTSAAVATPV